MLLYFATLLCGFVSFSFIYSIISLNNVIFFIVADIIYPTQPVPGILQHSSRDTSKDCQSSVDQDQPHPTEIIVISSEDEHNAGEK